MNWTRTDKEMSILLSKTCNKQKNFSKQMLIAIAQRDWEKCKKGEGYDITLQ